MYTSHIVLYCLLSDDHQYLLLVIDVNLTLFPPPPHCVVGSLCGTLDLSRYLSAAETLPNSASFISVEHGPFIWTLKTLQTTIGALYVCYSLQPTCQTLRVAT